MLKNTLLISLYSLVFAFPAPVLLALLLNEVKNARFKKTVQTITYLPHFISVVVVCGIVTNLLAPGNGIVNLLLEQLGLEKIYFLAIPEYFRTIFISMGIWQEMGLSAIIYIAALAGINTDLYEAAVVEGVNKWKHSQCDAAGDSADDHDYADSEDQQSAGGWLRGDYSALLACHL